MFSLSINLSIIFSINQLVVWSRKWWKMLIAVSQSSRWRPQMSCFVHNPKIFSLLSQRTKETRNIHISEAEIREFGLFFLKNNLSLQLYTQYWFICWFVTFWLTVPPFPGPFITILYLPTLRLFHLSQSPDSTCSAVSTFPHQPCST